MMNRKINILHLEDSLIDSELIHSIIENAEIRQEYFLADNEKEFLDILRRKNVDIILSDYSLPDYNGKEALKVARENYPGIPFIYVSGVMGEDAAINAMLSGATDYVLKNKLERLVPAIKRALYESELVIKHDESEAALHKSEEKYKDLINGLNDGYFVTDIHGIFTFVNLSLAKILGFSCPEELIGHYFTEFSKTRNLQKDAHIYNDLIDNRKSIEILELEVLRLDGVFIHIEIKAVPVLESGVSSGMMGVIRDISTRKRAELCLKDQKEQIEAQNVKYVQVNAELVIAKEKAEESNKLKTAFLQNMSHEIRTPLNAIIGFSELMNEEDISREEIKKYTAIIAKNGSRLIEIVNNVLDISKIQTGQFHIEQKPIEIKSILSDILTLFSLPAKTKNLALKCIIPDKQCITIYSDEAKLYQILTNLLNNAIKFSETGTIEFGYKLMDRNIEFYVKDSGIGIPREVCNSIFNSFIQVKSSLSGGHSGAGLGLPICKGLVELLGGSIWVETELSKGTTFFFTLPITHKARIDQPVYTFSDRTVKCTHGKILVAEDDWINFTNLKRLLEKSGILVLHAENGKMAVDQVRDIPDIDLVIMDLRMPVMDGIEAAKQIKQFRPGLPIIAHTAYFISEEIVDVLSNGCNEYLAKPFERDRLNALVNKYLPN